MLVEMPHIGIMITRNIYDVIGDLVIPRLPEKLLANLVRFPVTGDRHIEDIPEQDQVIVVIAVVCNVVCAGSISELFILAAEYYILRVRIVSQLRLRITKMGIGYDNQTHLSDLLSCLG
jgi:hypothetical protein